MNERFFHLTMASLALAFAGVSVLGLYVMQIQIQPHQLLFKLVLFLGLLVLAYFYRKRQEERLLNVVMIAFWGAVFGTLHLFPMFIAARTQAGLKDAVFASLDRAMGIEIPQLLSLIGAMPGLSTFLIVCYNMLLPLMVVAMIVPPVCGRMRPAKEYAIAGVISAVISMPLFALFPAAGPWVYYSYAPMITQNGYESVFQQLRENSIFTMDLSFRDGLICFPSFHTILAILAAVALKDVPYARRPASILALLIVIATTTTGAHYVIDVVAGIGVAILSIGASKAYTRMEAKYQGMEEPLKPRVKILQATAHGELMASTSQ